MNIKINRNDAKDAAHTGCCFNTKETEKSVRGQNNPEL